MFCTDFSPKGTKEIEIPLPASSQHPLANSVSPEESPLTSPRSPPNLEEQKQEGESDSKACPSEEKLEATPSSQDRSELEPTLPSEKRRRSNSDVQQSLDSTNAVDNTFESSEEIDINSSRSSTTSADAEDCATSPSSLNATSSVSTKEENAGVAVEDAQTSVCENADTDPVCENANPVSETPQLAVADANT